MVRIRLRRVGATNQPSYRIVVTNSRSPRDGRFIETIGFYNPRTNPETVNIKEDRALHWLSVGAKPSEAVERMLERRGTLARLKRLHAGEALEALAAEGEAAVAAMPQPSRGVVNRHTPQQPNPKKAQKAAQAAAEATAVQEVPAVEEAAPAEEVAAE